MPGGHSGWEPPDPISNSEVKTSSADGSVGSPHVRVGHRQVFILYPFDRKVEGIFFVFIYSLDIAITMEKHFGIKIMFYKRDIKK